MEPRFQANTSHNPSWNHEVLPLFLPAIVLIREINGKDFWIETPSHQRSHLRHAANFKTIQVKGANRVLQISLYYEIRRKKLKKVERSLIFEFVWSPLKEVGDQTEWEVWKTSHTDLSKQKWMEERMRHLVMFLTPLCIAQKSCLCLLRLIFLICKIRVINNHIVVLKIGMKYKLLSIVSEC